MFVGASMVGLLGVSGFFLFTGMGLRIWAGLGLFPLKLSERWDLSFIRLEAMHQCILLRMLD
jgi:hypothetical protein